MMEEGVEEAENLEMGRLQRVKLVDMEGQKLERERIDMVAMVEFMI